MIGMSAAPFLAALLAMNVIAGVCAEGD